MFDTFLALTHFFCHRGMCHGVQDQCFRRL